MIDTVRSSLLTGANGVSHAFCGRQGGVSTGIFASLNCGPGSGDDPEAVAENRRRAMSTVAADRLVTLYQIHSAETVTVTSAWTRDTAPKADGMATREKGLALGILTADCAPILFADVEAGVIGAAHSGWKGALTGVIEATVDKMIGLGADRDRIAACIGPCISQANYEVGPEFFDRFAMADPKNENFFEPSSRKSYWRFDLPGYAMTRLAAAGVAHAEAVDHCTYADEAALFSFRRTTHRGEPDYGRNLSLIVLS